LEAIKIGVSACLLGAAVRFNGGHKRDAFLTETFARHVEWVPVCPEVEIGLGVPRPSLRLVQRNGEVRLVEGPHAGSAASAASAPDYTARMRAYAEKRVAHLIRENLSGYVLKKNSPSCGMERVKVYSAGGRPARNGRGLFAEALIRACPDLPVEEEGRLADPRLRENFIERVFAYRGLRSLFAGRWTLGSLVAFHTAHKFQLLSHSTQAYENLGRIVAGAGRKPRDRSRLGKLQRDYQHQFMAALRMMATPARNANVLQHMAGYFKDKLDGAAKRELQDLIADYRSGLVPLIVPVTLIRHYVRSFDIAYLKGQTYLEPHPKELMLRNHV
jgi:uncharacterized protein YbgA (DUF1722 family)/uncharacterized protein YbbK (DUF523 family)